VKSIWHQEVWSAICWKWRLRQWNVCVWKKCVKEQTHVSFYENILLKFTDLCQQSWLRSLPVGLLTECVFVCMSSGVSQSSQPRIQHWLSLMQIQTFHGKYLGLVYTSPCDSILQWGKNCSTVFYLTVFGVHPRRVTTK